MLTHHNLLMNAYYVGQRLRYSADDRVCVPVPFYHCFGCVLGTLGLRGPRFDDRRPGTGLRRRGDARRRSTTERCTSVYGVPTMFVAQLQHPDFANVDLSSLRTGIMSGHPCPLPVDARRSSSRMGMRGDLHRLRPDGSVADHHVHLGRRPDRGPCRHGRQADPGARGQAGRPGHAAEPPPGRTGRTLRPRALRDGRILQQPRGDCPSHRRPRAGCTPATWPVAATTATTGSSAGARS